MSAVAPISPPPTLPGSPGNSQQFLAMLAEKFHCMQGPPRAYFEIPTGGTPPWTYSFVRGVYTCIKLASWARREDCERQLFGKLWELVMAARQELMEAYGEEVLPLLFWRTMPRIVEQPPTIPDLEEVGGYSTPHREFYRTNLYARLWIPGAPEFETLDWSRTQELIYV